jgi:RluA family pseudouridine synthase
MPATVEPDVNAEIQVLYEDDAIVVVNKPAPLPMHPCGRFNRNTLTYILQQVYSRQKLRPAHRLDANTTGVVILARTRRVAAVLQPQFKNGTVEKEYIARIAGVPANDRFSSSTRISTEKSPAGARLPDENGQAARTDFQVVERFADQTTLVNAVPTTGRTNQIRIHLWDLGMPVCGDPLYLADGKLGDVSTRTVDNAHLCLHAHRVTFNHPLSGERVTFTAEHTHLGA